MAAEDFIITRKRKKYKFARFSDLENCYEADEFRRNREQYGLRSDTDLVIELGSGTGLFLVELAKRRPDRQLVAVDVKSDRLYTGAKLAKENDISNIIFVRAHADQLLDIFSENSLKELWLTFSDPFPKKRHAKHRMSHPSFLRQYRKLLKSTGIIHFKTDNSALFNWSLEQFVSEGMILRRLSFDLHNSSLPDEYKVMTTYEKRYTAEGAPIYCVDAIFSEKASREPSRQ